MPIQTLEESLECTKCVAGFLVMHFQLTKVHEWALFWNHFL
jgi:hypothetical protein